MDMLNTVDRLPDIWGEGALFAFSGLDGATDTQSGFVATLGSEPYALLIHTPQRRTLRVDLPEQGVPRIVTGDVILVETTVDQLVVAFAAWHTLVGSIPPGAQIILQDAIVQQAVVIAESVHDTLVLVTQGKRFAIAYGATPAEARRRAEAGLTLELQQVVADRLAWHARLPALVDPVQARLLYKCFSVMKVNTLAPELSFADLWSTPDRVPHRYMWLWDSVFHSLAANRVYPDKAWLLLKSVLDMQQPDGMIPIQGSAEGWCAAGMTQPPLLAWGVWENYRHTGNRANLEYALPRLERYLHWNMLHRDRNRNYLLEWDIEENELCRSGESGMDNSPRLTMRSMLMLSTSPHFRRTICSIWRELLTSLMNCPVRIIGAYRRTLLRGRFTTCCGMRTPGSTLICVWMVSYLMCQL